MGAIGNVIEAGKTMIEMLQADNARLRDDIRMLREDIKDLRAENAELKKDNRWLDREYGRVLDALDDGAAGFYQPRPRHR